MDDSNGCDHEIVFGGQMKFDGSMEAFKQSLADYPSQDNEGFRPDRGGFKCGWFAALEWVSQKLEREAKVVYAALKDTWFESREQCQNHESHRALLICVEPIEACKHPAEKVSKKQESSGCLHAMYEHCNCVPGPMYFQCECGAKVKPKEYEAIK